MSNTVRRIEVSEDVDFVPEEDTTEFFEFYGITDPVTKERVVLRVADAMRAYEKTRVRRRRIEEHAAERAIAATRAC